MSAREKGYHIVEQVNLKSQHDFRFYSFVAGLYLSPLQCGLQTAHAVSEMYANTDLHGGSLAHDIWAKHDKTIIILTALNSAGVTKVHADLAPLVRQLNLPISIFHEDEESLNGAATATGIILPKRLYDVQLETSGAFIHLPDEGPMIEYLPTTVEHRLIEIVKSYRFA